MTNTKQQRKIQNFALCLIVFSFAFFILHLNEAYAAVLFFDAPEHVSVGEEFEAAVLLDAEGESVNAISGVIKVSGEAASVVSVRDGGSIVPLFVAAPAYEDGLVSFTGIIPGGFTGVARPFETGLLPGRVITLVFRAQAAGDLSLSFRETEVLRNADESTPVPLTTLPAEVSISSSTSTEALGTAGGNGGEVTVADTKPPEPFDPIVFSDSSYFDGTPVLLFNTQDRESGVAYYELFVSDHKVDDYSASSWTRITSPHPLSGADVHRFLSVKAVDYAGNERIGIVSPQQTSPYGIFIIVFLVLFILSPVLYFFFFIRRA